MLFADKPAPSVATYNSKSDFMKELDSSGDGEYCVVINMEELDVENYNYKIELSVPAAFSPDTSKPLYNKLVRLPDLDTYGKILQGSSVAAYPYITEFIARKQAGHNMDDTTPFLK